MPQSPLQACLLTATLTIPTDDKYLPKKNAYRPPLITYIHLTTIYRYNENVNTATATSNTHVDDDSGLQVFPQQRHKHDDGEGLTVSA